MTTEELIVRVFLFVLCVVIFSIYRQDRFFADPGKTLIRILLFIVAVYDAAGLIAILFFVRGAS